MVTYLCLFVAFLVFWVFAYITLNKLVQKNLPVDQRAAPMNIRLPGFVANR